MTSKYEATGLLSKRCLILDAVDLLAAYSYYNEEASRAYLFRMAPLAHPEHPVASATSSRNRPLSSH